jgi:transcriptional regulator with XRE-family HTH domain
MKKTRTMTHKTPAALLLLDKDATLGRVSHGTHLSASYLSYIFNGKRVPSLHVAARIASYLGCSIDKLHVTLQSITKKKTTTNKCQ